MSMKWKIVYCIGCVLLFNGTGCSTPPTVEDVQKYCPLSLPASTRVIEFDLSQGIDTSCRYILSFSPGEYQGFKKSWGDYTKTHEAPFGEGSSDPATWTYCSDHGSGPYGYIKFTFDDTQNHVTGYFFTM